MFQKDKGDEPLGLLAGDQLALVNPGPRRWNHRLVSNRICARGRGQRRRQNDGLRPIDRRSREIAMPVSDTTILRSVKECVGAQPTRGVVRVAGIDEWAWRKGMTFGTVIVDLERRQVVELLADRSAGTAADWFKRHPEIEVVSRDRAGLYADAARQGAATKIFRPRSTRDIPLSGRSGQRPLRKPDTSYLAVPIRNHAFFEQAQFQGLLGDDLLQRPGFPTQVLDLAAGRRPLGVTRKAPFAGLQELLRPGVIQALGDALAPAE